MTRYYLPPHVYLCRRGDAFVFLDLKSDDYTLVNGRAAATLWASIEGADDPTEETDALAELLRAGLLTTDHLAGKDALPTFVDVATDCLVDNEILPSTQASVRHVWNFLVAYTTATIRLRCTRLENTVGRVQARKQQRGSTKQMNPSAVRELTAIFQKVRLLFPRDHVCLYDSLALIEFLAKYGIYPDWVFGIKLEPWAAHCWVQQGKFLFNESADEAVTYSPVMSI